MKKNYTRREFVNNSLYSLALLSLPKYFYSLGKDKIKNNKIGLFFSKEDLPRIKENTQLPIFKDYWETLVNINFDEKKSFIEKAEFNRHWDHLRVINGIVLQSAFVFLITDDKRHEELAKIGIKKILEYNNWDYFIEKDTNKIIGMQIGPDTTITMCLAYDWLNERLSDTEKDNIIQGIINKGVSACYNSLYYMRNPEKSNLWLILPDEQIKFEADTKRWPYFLNKTNLKIIPTTGLTFASVLLYDKHPDAKKWLELARWAVETSAKIYYKDGSYDEGVSYWDYSTRHIIMAVELLRRNLNIDYTNDVNFKGSIKFVLQMMAPFKDFKFATVNFSDAGFNPDATAGFWVAKQFKDGLAQYASQNISGRRNMFAFIYYDKNINPQPPSKQDLNVKFDVGWIVSRTGWTEEDSLLAFRGGNPANHEHADRNSFIFQAFGDRLLHDPMGAAYRASEKHWVLRLTEAHNAVLIDGKGHFFHDGKEGTNMTIAKATTLKFEYDDKLTKIISDATQPYNLVNKDVKKVIRTLYFFKPDIIILVDEVEKKNNPSKIQVRFHPFNLDAKASVSLKDDNCFIISRPYAKLFGKIFSKQNMKINTSKLDIPKDNIVFPNANANVPQEFPFVEGSTQIPEKKSIIISFLIAQKSEIKEEPIINYSEKANSLLIEVQNNKITSKFEVMLNKKYPIIKKI
ncbi:MAG TPA: heparinase II/III family protein [Ignavibacteria bacterium]